MSATAVGALLAVGAALALNASYLVQHVGSARSIAVDARRPIASLASLLRSPVWALGGVVGVAGWGLHIAAMREAPLSVVQAFVAGGLALAVPMAAAGLRLRIAPREAQGIGLVAVALVLLGIGLHDTGSHARFAGGGLAAWTAVSIAGAALIATRMTGRHRPLALALAGGLLYGAADLCLKAVTGLGSFSQIALSPWLAAGLLCTAAAFFAFQRGLQSDRPLSVVAVMTAATNVSSIAGAFAIFGDPLGSTPGLRAVHVLAFALVVVATWRLAPAADRLLTSSAATTR